MTQQIKQETLEEIGCSLMLSCCDSQSEDRNIAAT
jgi:hypothetical protein